MATPNQQITTSEGTIVPSLLDYLRVVSRRKTLFLLIALLVPATAVAVSLSQSPTYGASAEVLVRPVADSIAGTPPVYDPARVAETQAKLARVPAVVNQVLDSVPSAGLDQEEFLEASSVSTAVSSDLLTFSVESSDPDLAKQLATTYAHAFTEYQQQLETQAVEAKLEVVRQQLESLEASGATGTPTYAALRDEERQLAALAAVQTPSAQVVREADRAPKVGPRTVRNALIAFCLGVVLALIVVFLVDALDTRVRSVDRIREVLRMRLLGRLPTPSSRFRDGQGLVMLADPTSREAEPFRVLRASLEFANAENAAQVIMITSAADGEGKSTTAANLAVALARTGRRVVLIDADVGRPGLHRLFGLDERPGLTDLALGDASLEEALRPIAVTEKTSEADHFSSRTKLPGSLRILPGGSALQDPDELGFENPVGSIVQRVWSHADIVLVDAPPLLTSHAIALSAHVDAIAVVVRLKTLREPALQDLARILDVSPAVKLGFIVTGVSKREGYGQHQRYVTPARRVESKPRLRLTASPAAADGENHGDGRPAESTYVSATDGAGDRPTSEDAVREGSKPDGKPFGGLSPSEAGKRSGQTRRAKAAQATGNQEPTAADPAQDALEDA